MIVLQRPHGARLFFVMRGSILPRIAPALATCTAVAVVVTLTRGFLFQWKITLTPVPFSLIGLALAIFLGFRNSAAYERYWEAPNLDQIAPAKYNSLLAYPHLAARLRTLASPEAVGFAVRAVTQRDGYEPLARVELFAELAAYFRELVRFPDTALEGLTDEQFVRSVLRVVFNRDS